MPREYEIPEWMTEHIIDVLGGRAHIIELMSGQRALTDGNAPLALAQQDMEGKIALLRRLHDEGMLTGLDGDPAS